MPFPRSLWLSPPACSKSRALAASQALTSTSIPFSVAREKVFEARIAELAAAREELAIRRTETAERLEKAKQKLLRAEEKVLRDKAQLAFLAAGGARGDFAREWLSVFTEEVRGARRSTATGRVSHSAFLLCRQTKSRSGKKTSRVEVCHVSTCPPLGLLPSYIVQCAIVQKRRQNDGR